MNQEGIFDRGRVRKFFEKFPMLWLKYLSGPLGSDLSVGGKGIRVRRIHGRQVVVSEEDNGTSFTHDLHTLIWIGPVTDNVSKAYNAVDRFLAKMIQNPF
jgi:hypothetical protein